jgi:hypothetical protein
MARNVAISVLRGVFANMPTLQDGEFYFATDTGQLYVGLSKIPFKVGGAVMAAVEINGNANPTNYIEPRPSGAINVSPGDQPGVALVMQSGTITTTSVTAGQIILTYTVPANFTLYLTYLKISGRLTTLSATASVLGTVSVQIGGVTVYQDTVVNPTTSDAGGQRINLDLGLPIPITGGTVVSVIVTPVATTSMLWFANFGGYTK